MFTCLFWDDTSMLFILSIMKTNTKDNRERQGEGKESQNRMLMAKPSKLDFDF